ncbi:transferrin isoform X1 [Dendroctonus ponderosae]|uniref:transferrin isoform X1 n=1 Tax=Dendroctonus ponderosae TaxID=77166 RepID=UPI002036516F|nr:transferrin isoform X1 [Dendroctonus ponderosae]
MGIKVKMEVFRVCLVLWIWTIRVSFIHADKLCIESFNSDACQQVARDQDMNCQYVTSRVDCVLDIEQNLPTLTLLNSEDAFLAAGLVTNTTTVIAEVVEENAPYQTVVIVKWGYLGGVSDQLKGLKYCHPGYNHDERITKWVLEELDWKAVSLNCSANQTLTEQKFQALASFFGSSCRPGKWTEDQQFDAYLKSTYPSLCDLCGSAGCSTNYRVPLNDSLTCLTNNDADLALSALSYAETFFSIGSNAQNYQYLCPNGSLASSTNPCVWTKQLSRLFVTSSSSASDMQTYLQTKLASFVNPEGGTPYSLEQHLASLLQLGRLDKINVIAATPLSSYVAERRVVPNADDPEADKCNASIMWSVINDPERSKCTWLRQASLTHGLLPLISCVQSVDNDSVSNLDNIRNLKAGIAYIDANFGYIARRKQLINVGYPETDTRQLSKISIVVRNDSTWYDGRLSSLAGKHACIPEYGGKEWLAFVDLLRNNSLINDTSDYGSVFSQFVGESCAPGAKDKDIDIPNTDGENLCDRCYPVDATKTAKYCNADSLNKYFQSSGALLCLRENNGDYAVVSLNDLPGDYLANATEQEQFRIISKNGSLAAYAGFNVDEEAPIIIIISGELVFGNASSVTTATHTYNDTVLYLREMEVEFGSRLEKSFKVFDRFNHTRNLLFPDSTPGITISGGSNKYISNYQELLKRSQTGQTVSSSALPVALPIFVALLLAAITRLV